MREQIAAQDGLATLHLSQEILDDLDLKVGDEIDLSVVDGVLVVQPVRTAQLSKDMEEIVQGLLKRRRSVYEALAAGAE